MSDQPSRTMYCYQHPSIQANLTCIRCERPICIQCMTRSPVGFRCVECGKPDMIPTYKINPLVLSKAIIASQLTAIILGVLLTFLSKVLFLDFFTAIIIFAASSFLVTEIINKITNYKKGGKLQIVSILSIVSIYLIYNLFSPYLLVSAHILALFLASYVCYIRLK